MTEQYCTSGSSVGPSEGTCLAREPRKAASGSRTANSNGRGKHAKMDGRWSSPAFVMGRCLSCDGEAFAWPVDG